MKHLLLLLISLWCTTSIFAAVSNPNYEKAIQLRGEAKYVYAVKYFLKALKEKQDNHFEARTICFEIADCYYKDGNTAMAIRFLRIAIDDYGATYVDFLTDAILNKEFSEFAWSSIEPDYNNLRSNYMTDLKNIQTYKKQKYLVISNQE